MKNPKPSQVSTKLHQAAGVAHTGIVSQALLLFRHGNLREAEQMIRSVLQRTPNDVQALQAMGMIAAQSGRLDEAERLLRRCVKLAPNQPAGYINLANLLMELNRSSEAESFYRQAINISPQMPVAHYNYGRCLRVLGKLDEAILSYRQALRLKPDFFEAGINLGSALCEKEAYQEAESIYRSLLEIYPEKIEIRVYLADIMRLRGQTDQARFEYENILQTHPENPQARLSLGLLLIDQHELTKAAELIEPLVEERRLPKADVLSALALLRARQGDQKTAISLLSQVIQVGPGRLHDYLNLAIWYAEIRNRDQALEILEKARERFGDQSLELLGYLIVNQRHLCDWRRWDERIKNLVEGIKNTDRALVSPFVALSIPALDSADLLKVSRQFAKRFQPWVEQSSKLPPLIKKVAFPRRLRIGYLSCDFHEHATAYLTARVFEKHDRSRFEIFAYSWGPDDRSDMRHRLLRAFDEFVEIGTMSHFDAASRIRADGIDILVDLKGYTRNARTEILALRPCPIQVNWLGYPGSMGTSFIDYIIVDPVIAPENHAEWYAEKLAYLPDAYAPVDDLPLNLKTPTRAEVGLPEQVFVFCSFNNPYKITPRIFEIWCNLLKDIEDSVLWLFAERESVARNLRREARLRGVAPERLIFAPKVSHQEHLARLTLADLCLDTLPYNAHTTASDALRAGVPMLTCMGTTFPGRVAASLLTAADMPDLIVHDLHDYEARARFLANNPDELMRIRERLKVKQREAAYFDQERFTRNLESLYQRMWRLYQRGESPQMLMPIQFDQTGQT